MEKKYILTNETNIYKGRILHRIQAVRNFVTVKAGDLGGWIEKEENLSHKGSCWVFDEAKVFDNARVCGDALVRGNAQVCDDAQVFENAQLYGNAQVFGNARVYGTTQIYGGARVIGSAQILNNAWICGDAQVFGNAMVLATLWYTLMLKSSVTLEYLILQKYLKTLLSPQLPTITLSAPLDPETASQLSTKQKTVIFGSLVDALTTQLLSLRRR